MYIKPKLRCPTKKSIEKLSVILSVPNTPQMQDWEWEIADSKKLNDYISIYNKDHMTNDDRFTIMETILQAVECRIIDNGVPPRSWIKIKKILEKNKELHKDSIYYWSDIEWSLHRNASFKVSRYLRDINIGK